MFLLVMCFTTPAIFLLGMVTVWNYISMSVYVLNAYLIQSSAQNPQHQVKCLANSHNFKQTSTLDANSIPGNSINTLFILTIFVLMTMLLISLLKLYNYFHNVLHFIKEKTIKESFKMCSNPTAVMW